MKARVKATGEIVEVMYSHTAKDKGCDIIWYITPRGASFSKEELEFIDTGESLNYWTRLEHQYAGMAMQGILANQDLIMSICRKHEPDRPIKETICELAEACAQTLVEKMKEERK